jgi:hypothetical protein
VQQEARHRAIRAGVDALRGAEEPDAEGDQFLDAANAVSYTTAPTIELPHEHGLEPAEAGVVEQAVELGAARLAPLKPASRYSAKTCQPRFWTYWRSS